MPSSAASCSPGRAAGSVPGEVVGVGDVVGVAEAARDISAMNCWSTALGEGRAERAAGVVGAGVAVTGSLGLGSSLASDGGWRFGGSV